MSDLVITGQQIGLLGGPLYTTYKVLGALHYAKQIAGEALYWLETNDADFNEINHIDYLDSEGKLRNLTWNLDSRGFSCGLIEVGDSLVALLEQFFSSLRTTEFTPALRDIALSCYVPGRTLSEASSDLASALFGRFNIRLFTPAEKKFRKFSRTILQGEAERTPEGQQCNLFCMIGKKREALFKKGGNFCLRDGSPVDMSLYDLVPNVKTRNVCQDAYFNTQTYIAGPGEIKYIADLDPVYRFHKVKKAAVKARMSLFLVEPKVNRLIKKTGVTLAEVLEHNSHALIKKVIREKSGFDFKETLRQAETVTGEYIGELESLGLDISDVNPLLRSEVKKICGKRRTVEKEKQSGLIESLQYLSDNLKPYGKKQERVFNIFYYMNLFGGTGFVDWLYKHHDFAIDRLEI